jgi:hypothetical protein
MHIIYGQTCTDDTQDKNTPAIVSLAAGGVAGAVEGAISVSTNSENRAKSRVTDLSDSIPWSLPKPECN